MENELMMLEMNQWRKQQLTMRGRSGSGTTATGHLRQVGSAAGGPESR